MFKRNFLRVTCDLTPLRHLNLMDMHELNLAQSDAQKTFQEKKRLFDLEAKLESVRKVMEFK